MITGKLPARGTDDWGQGWYGASRGKKTHRGIDLVAAPDTYIMSHVVGKVTKIGLPYLNEEFRYVEITDVDGYKHRYFYVNPLVQVADFVGKNDVIGQAQDIAGKYTTPDKKMKNHIHYEVKRGGRYFNPAVFDA